MVLSARRHSSATQVGNKGGFAQCLTFAARRECWVGEPKWAVFQRGMPHEDIALREQDDFGPGFYFAFVGEAGAGVGAGDGEV